MAMPENKKLSYQNSQMGLVVRKPVFGGSRQSEFQTSLLSYRD